MFKIEDLYVDDKRLGDLLKAVAGIAKGTPRAVPMMNIDDRLAANSGGGNLSQVFADHLVKNKIEAFSPQDVKMWLAKNGRSKLSASYITKGLIKVGMIKRTGQSSATRYTVQRAKR